MSKEQGVKRGFESEQDYYNVHLTNPLAFSANKIVKTENMSNDQAFITAVQQGHTETVKALLEKGANIETRSKDEEIATPLWIAANNGHTEIVKALLEKGASVNTYAQGVTISTPLWIAANNGHTETVKALLEKGASIETRIKGGTNSSPLWIAANNGHAEIVKALFKKGASPKEECGVEKEKSAFFRAIKNGHIETVEVFIKKGEWDFFGPTWPQKNALCTANNHSRVDVAKVLLENLCKIEGFKSDHHDIFNFVFLRNLIDHVDDFQLNPSFDYNKLKSELEFVGNTFHKVWVTRGIKGNFESYKNKISETFKNVMSDDLIYFINEKINHEEKIFKTKVEMLESSLIHFIHDISPMPFIESEERSYSYNFNSNAEEATPSAIKEHKIYNEFWNDPQNAKYKIAGNYLLELMQDEGNINLPTLEEILLRSKYLDKELLSNSHQLHNNNNSINPLHHMKKVVKELNQDVVLPQEIKQALGIILSKYKIDKKSALIKTTLSLYDKTQVQEKEIESLKKEQTAQTQKMNNLENIVKMLAESAGINVSNINNTTNTDLSVQESPLMNHDEDFSFSILTVVGDNVDNNSMNDMS